MTAIAKQKPMQEGLYTWPSPEPQLIASKCEACGEVAFPKQGSCPSCAAEETREILLSRRGKLWTWTIQHFPPPTPPFAGDRASFAPFGVGYIELPEGIRIESRLTVNEPGRLAIGMEMDLVVEKFKDADDGGELVTFAFAPAAD